MREHFSFWWGLTRRLYRLAMPGRYYALYTGAGLAVFVGALLLSVSLTGLGYTWAGRGLAIVTLSALGGILAGSLLHFVRVQLRRLDAEIAHQVLETRHRAELAERSRRLRIGLEATAAHAAKAEAERLQRQQQALQSAQASAFVYFIVDWQRRVVKIGVSQSPQKRLAALQTSNSHPLDLAVMVSGGYALERQLHEQYAAYRLSGEWFQLAQEIVDRIEKLKAAQDRNAGQEQA